VLEDLFDAGCSFHRGEPPSLVVARGDVPVADRRVRFDLAECAGTPNRWDPARFSG